MAHAWAVTADVIIAGQLNRMIHIRDDARGLFPEKRVDQFCAITGQVYREVRARRTTRFKRRGKDFFVKCHGEVGWSEIFKNLLRLRLPVIGARSEWQAIRRLERLGLSTTRWVAFGEAGWNPAQRRSFVVTEALQGTRNMEHWARQIKAHPDAAMRARTKWAMIRSVARLTRTLHGNGINHRDYYLCHLRLAAKDAEFFARPGALPIYIMDLHRAQLRRRTPTRWTAKDIEALLYSTRYGPARLALTTGDMVRFLQVYCGPEWRRSLARDRRLWALVIKRLCRSYKREFHRPLALSRFQIAALGRRPPH